MLLDRQAVLQVFLAETEETLGQMEGSSAAPGRAAGR